MTPGEIEGIVMGILLASLTVIGFIDLDKKDKK